MYNYVQLDENGYVVGCSQLAQKIDNPNMILVDNDPNITFGWQYKNGKWFEPEEVKPQVAKLLHFEPTNTEVIQAIEDLKIDLIIAGVIKDV